MNSAFDRSVFVNCPFDRDYLPLLHALLFAISDCGFAARIAIQDSGSGETRVDKIMRLIRESRFSIHDISRVELSDGRFPRFNMPFECGLAFGLSRWEVKARRDLLIMDSERHQDKRTLSDLSGQDMVYHQGDAGLVIQGVRHFLAAKVRDLKLTHLYVRDDETISKRLQQFETELPGWLPTGLSPTKVRQFEYLADWIYHAARWQAETP